MLTTKSSDDRKCKRCNIIFKYPYLLHRHLSCKTNCIKIKNNKINIKNASVYINEQNDINHNNIKHLNYQEDIDMSKYVNTLTVFKCNKCSRHYKIKKSYQNHVRANKCIPKTINQIISEKQHMTGQELIELYKKILLESDPTIKIKEMIILEGLLKKQNNLPN